MCPDVSDRGSDTVLPLKTMDTKREAIPTRIELESMEFVRTTMSTVGKQTGDYPLPQTAIECRLICSYVEK